MKMLMKMAGLKVEFQYWMVRLAAVISKGLDASLLALYHHRKFDDVIGIQSEHPTNGVCPSQCDSPILCSYNQPRSGRRKR